MALPNDIVLRPRFKYTATHSNEHLLQLFDERKTSQSHFIVTRIDDHVFIKFPKNNQSFWTPQLHLEITPGDSPQQSVIYGLFGPNPTVWTLFMFLHFIVAVTFLGFGVWAYANWSLEQEFTLQLFGCMFMIVLWFGLYLSGRMGKQTGKAQMSELNEFMLETLKHHDLSTTN